MTRLFSIATSISIIVLFGRDELHQVRGFSSTKFPRSRQQRSRPQNSNYEDACGSPSIPSPTSTSTSLRATDYSFINDHYYAIAGGASGLILTMGSFVSRNIAMTRAWEQRLKEGQMQRGTEGLTELDLRTELAEKSSPTIYGREARRRRMQREAEEKLNQKNEQRPSVADFDVFADEDGGDDDYALFMTQEEIEEFESMYGIKYDPNYDEPYEEDELPEGDFTVDGYFGDRIYRNEKGPGEVFFRDGNVFRRKGCRPFEPQPISWKK